MLKDNIEKEVEKIKEENNMSENMNINLRGELEIWGIDKDGKVYHHEKDSNIVTNYAKHASIHLMSGEVFSTHGNRDIDGVTAYSRRSSSSGDHTMSTNNDGTMISNEQFLGDNINYDNDLTGDRYNWSLHNESVYPASPSLGDENPSSYNFNYALFPTKILFGTGIEYSSWQEVINDGKNGGGQDGYGNPSNGGWDQTSFDKFLIDAPIEKNNYYSANFNGVDGLTKCRTVNDVYAGALSDTNNPMTPENFAVKGAVKDATFNGSNESIVLQTIDGKLFAKESYRGIGKPAFIYAKRNLRFMEANSEVRVELGAKVGTEHLESKITYTVIMPKQETGQFYPYNGYTVKVAGLFADAAMLLKNTIPLDSSQNDDAATSNREFYDYVKMPTGILWATRNISPITKSHDTSIVAQWTIYM